MKERPAFSIPGWPLFIILMVGPFFYGKWLYGLHQSGGISDVALAIVAFVSFILWSIFMGGLFVLEPGNSRVLTLFGKYVGTARKDGMHWVNPFTSKKAVSLRARTLNGLPLKVNDSMGNPIEIAAVVVWQVRDTYRALFEVENYESYVAMQSETALRHTASMFPYDADEESISLRRNTTEVGDHLRDELGERLALAGVEIIEARLSHLAYAPEIAGAMLRRQQASAVVSARQLIVEGAVGMVEMALTRLEKDKVVELSDSEKSQLVSNLMVVLCSEQAAQPVLSAGSTSP